MAMPLITAVHTSLRKYRRKKLRAFFGIAPTVLLFVFIVLLSGVALSIDHFINNRILLKLEQREEVFELNRDGGAFYGPPRPSDTQSETEDKSSYTLEDINKIKSTAHIVDVQPERPLPDTFAVTKDLVPNKELQISNLVGAPADLAKLYNAEKFDYSSDQPIPIIINRATFNYQYLDFGGKNEIELTEKDFRDPTRQRELNPLKGNFLSDSYDKNQLLNKTFTVNFGGLPRLPQYHEKSVSDRTSYKMTYKQLTAAESQTQIKNQRDSVSPYWNYDSLQKGIGLKFKIVGFNESLDNTSQFIPLEASGYILQQIFDLQRSSRTSNVLPQESYSKYGGLRLSGNNHVSSDIDYMSSELIPAIRQNVNGPSESDSQAIRIPGWLTQVKTKDSNSTFSEVSSFTFKSESFPIKALAVRIDDAANREKAQKALSAAGFPEAGQSASFTTFLRGIRKGISTALFWIVAVLTAINSLILISTVSRTVADAQREIGVYRALGARKRDIRKLYIVYSALQTAIGIGAGLLVGLLMIVPTSRFLADKVQNFLPIEPGAGATIMGFDLTISPADLQYIDWQGILMYSTGLLIVTVAISLLPATRAARISPVESIRRGD